MFAAAIDTLFFDDRKQYARLARLTTHIETVATFWNTCPLDEPAFLAMYWASLAM